MQTSNRLLKQSKPARQDRFTYFIFKTRQGICVAGTIFHPQINIKFNLKIKSVNQTCKILKNRTVIDSES
ncbi:hypothetical protein MSTHC_0129 [Methanosarcina thermophila CHTI-55]|uniref:Uncharacterized protein n=2 Tax=Methanosarcina thermophila TaxID=2210 RepID=A0A0E3KZR7_METTE|nr:hypothetical protein MSTHT_0591 [Methanosarcina thermophila TM-1]AKB14447.1 hypothetical protein MSTHC_0129 [Methanosarcina thermophila CHTI-55]